MMACMRGVSEGGGQCARRSEAVSMVMVSASSPSPASPCPPPTSARAGSRDRTPYTSTQLQTLKASKFSYT